MASTFIASYDGECPECERPIFAGDTAGYVDDNLLCQGCLDEYEDDDATS